MPSFRWSNDVNNTVDEGSKKLGISKTQYVINAVDILQFLMNHEQFIGLTTEQIKAKIETLISDDIRVTSVATVTIPPSNGNKRKPGYIYDHVFEYIKTQTEPCTTSQISAALSVPKSTVRAYVKKLSETYPDNIVLIRGKPNFIFYKEEK